MAKLSYFSLRLFLPVILCSLIPAFAQDLPKRIDGYKVHSEIIRVTNDPKTSHGKIELIVGEPTVSDVSLSGVTIAIAGEMRAAGFDGLIDRMTFLDFKVNGVPVDVEKFDTPFRVSKAGTTSLPVPATVFLSTPRLLQAAWKETTGPNEKWNVNGRVFVFGHFKKFGFSFKRVVPVEVRLKINNPLVDQRKRS